ncbi:MAG: hypothetical protein ACO3JL_04850 [Myxococcota bacterium]
MDADRAAAVTGQAIGVARAPADLLVLGQTHTEAGRAKLGYWDLPEGAATRGQVALRNTTTSRVAGAAGAMASVAQLPGAAYTAQRDVRRAVREPTRENVAGAVGSSVSLVGTAAGATKGVLNTTAMVQTERSARRAAAEAFRAAVPGASTEATRAAAQQATASALRGESARLAGSAAESGARAQMRGAGQSVAQGAGPAQRAAAREMLRQGGKASGQAAVRAATRAGTGAVARAAARFTPGLNIAMAAADTAASAATWANPKASTAKKVMSSITAVGSVAAATNIPIVSQVGAGVSLLSGVVGGFLR